MSRDLKAKSQPWSFLTSFKAFEVANVFSTAFMLSVAFKRSCKCHENKLLEYYYKRPHAERSQIKRHSTRK